ncbi:MAG: hypothetical protein IPN65_07435 [Elusimicrobia bacterium]|nr:hypothetical protein [Elusimicrobiota bacterium]MBK7207689.1 hypothetical protein [Elusimicrobiota bacterium]MBK7544450.1 hypothetical protein [Elusimicrobiota bacterium]MBK7573973.1 hypothetical protein [Elusimicrobiota bacterium]MBK7689078.1 hypothetical protein [Elusimicrobiota bacterium]
MSAAFDVHCPCCKAQLTVSPEARAVVSHKAATPPKPVASLDEGVAVVKKDPERRAGLFAQSLETEKSKADRLKKSFNDLLQKAKEDPDAPRPVRDMDLD